MLQERARNTLAVLSWGTECTADSNRVRLAAVAVDVGAVAGVRAGAAPAPARVSIAAGLVFAAAGLAAGSTVVVVVVGAVVVQPPWPRPNGIVLLPRLVTARPRRRARGFWP